MYLVLSVNDENCEVMRVLRVSRATVYNYRVQGNSTDKVMTNGPWNYDEEAVYKWSNDDVQRKNFVVKVGNHLRTRC
jgi:predicted site-specific integrase-resolvase